MVEKMIIDYIINDPETVEHGITLRSAIAGFFYTDNSEALRTKVKLAGLIKVSQKIKGSEQLANVLPRLVEPTPIVNGKVVRFLEVNFEKD